LKNFYEKRQKRAQERKNGIPEGEMAPDFTLKNDKGHDVALSSLRGKYIVLDFWGTWCGWCIKGVPAMKEMYKKYSDRLEIVGIACGDTEDVWKECIAKNGMNWTNLINNDNVNVPKMYSIKGFPTKIILDEKGRVLKTVIGESAEFYTYIDSLMK
jgi:thiol-disulfide isomerase/thioredoxin